MYIQLYRLKKKQTQTEKQFCKLKLGMEYQEDQDLEGLVEKTDLQDQLEKLVHQDFKGGEDQKALRVLVVFQVELVPMVIKGRKDNLVKKGYKDLEVLLDHLDHQDVHVTI